MNGCMNEDITQIFINTFIQKFKWLLAISTKIWRLHNSDVQVYDRIVGISVADHIMLGDGILDDGKRLQLLARKVCKQQQVFYTWYIIEIVDIVQWNWSDEKTFHFRFSAHILKWGGWLVKPTVPSSSSLSVPSGGVMWKCLMMEVRNKNSSCLARISPRQLRRPDANINTLIMREQWNAARVAIIDIAIIWSIIIWIE